jgi:hypothetical protein
MAEGVLCYSPRARSSFIGLLWKPFWGHEPSKGKNVSKGVLIFALDLSKRWGSVQRVQTVQVVQPLRSVQSPTSFLPRVAGEYKEGLNDWNGLNVLNGHNLNGRTFADTNRRERRLC